MKIFVLAKPLAKKEKVEKIDETNFKVWVKEPPRQGKADEAIRKVLAKYFKIPTGNIILVSGFRQKNKQVLIRRLTPPK